MNFNSKIVPFDRSAAYMHHRAMKNRRDNNLVDALELLRRAVEHSPENQEYRLDMAEIYCEMGCYEQSSRLLLDMLAQQDAPAECYYGLALNRLGMNNEEGARIALKQYLVKEPDGVHSEDVRNLRAELDFTNELARAHGRRRLRAQRIAERACNSMREEDFEKARVLFERSLKLFPEQREMRALYAMNLQLMGNEDDALAECKYVLEGSRVSVRALCVVAQIYQMSGLEKECAQILERAQSQDPDGIEMRLLIYSVSEMENHKLVSELTRRALFETPYDRTLLHVRAVALYKSGAGAEQAGRFWARILRIDPEDTVAAYYEELALRDALNDEELTYAYQVPPAEAERRLKYVAAKLEGGEEAAVREWRENAVFRQLLKWCLEAGNMQFQRGAVLVLSALDDEGAVSTLREFLSRGSAPAEMRRYAALMLHMRGAQMEKYLPADMGAGLAVDAKELIERFPVGQRQMLRYAAEVLERQYGLSASAWLAFLWQTYRKKRCMRIEPLTRTETAAAALAACYLRMEDREADISTLSRQFGCSKRQLKYFLNRIVNSTGKESENDETD